MNASLLETLFKWLFLFSALTVGVSFFYKDVLPTADYYDHEKLEPPKQTETLTPEFTTHISGQTYTIKPKFHYELDGVIVSYHDADGFDDIWHHARWQDYLNLRDLCVIWGTNVESGVYQHMTFSNDSWTCWASWPDQTIGKRFKMNALSNNHLLSDDEAIKKELMAAEPGDHIHLSGLLSEYSNPGNGFQRGTSINRDDQGNGACETIFLDEFTIVNKANRKVRQTYSLAIWLTLFSAVGYLIMFGITPVKNT